MTRWHIYYRRHARVFADAGWITLLEDAPDPLATAAPVGYSPTGKRRSDVFDIRKVVTIGPVSSLHAFAVSARCLEKARDWPGWRLQSPPLLSVTRIINRALSHLSG